MAKDQWREFSPEESEENACVFGPGSLNRDMLIHENGMVMPKAFVDKLQERIKQFELRPDDIWIITYPKCGTTWTQELVWMLVNDVNTEAGQVSLHERVPFLEMNCLLNLDAMKAMGWSPTVAL